ncbi:MAG: class I SAM-dependent methyltransferase [Nitrospirae bacterium]|nr:class I SAM-dependent methyltransferase [Nitrospirota bacterium]
MGISISSMRLIGKTMKDRRLSGKCVTYGVQGIEGQYGDVKRILSLEGYKYRNVAIDSIIMDDITQYGNTIHQSVFFNMLGFDVVDSIDVFTKENPTHVLNLNEPIERTMHGRYDMVYDGGTAEHCFDIPEVLSNTVRLLKAGGTVIHHLPISGYLEHGYYQFSPSLFFDFYKANNFTDIEAKIHISYSNRKSCYFDFTSPAKLPDNFGHPAMIFFTAKKRAGHNDVVFPVQSVNPEHFIRNAMTESFLSALYTRLPRGFAFKALQLLKKITCMYACKRLQ